MDCDEDANKAFCSSLGVKGFPTLKTVRPGKKPGSKPIVEDYRGERTTSAIVDDVVTKINNHVVKLEEKELPGFLNRKGPRAILFTEKGTTSALLRGIAIDYLGVISVGQLRVKDKSLAEKFGVKDFPALVVLPDKEQNPVFYSGEMKKAEMVEFLKTWGEPNPDPAPSKKGEDNKKPKEKKPKPKAEEPTAEPADPVEAAMPEETPDPVGNSVIPIMTAASHEVVAGKCFQSKSHTCVLMFAPADIASSEDGKTAFASLSLLNTKYVHGKRHLFPFLSVPNDIEGIDSLKKALGINADVSMIALNARRKWWRQYEGDYSVKSVESWIDAIRMGEGSKKDIPDGVVEEMASREKGSDAKVEEEVKATQATGPEPEIETEAPEKKNHDEL